VRLSCDIKHIKVLRDRIKSAEKDLYDHFSEMHKHCPVSIGDEVKCNRGGNKGEVFDIDNISIIRHGYHHAFECSGRLKRKRGDGKQTHSRGVYLISFKQLEEGSDGNK